MQSAAEKALNDREDMRQKLLKVRGVLRVPRLWKEFRDNLEKLKKQITEAGHKKGQAGVDEIINKMDGGDRILYLGIDDGPDRGLCADH